MFFCMDDMRAIRSLIDTLRIPSLENRVCLHFMLLGEPYELIVLGHHLGYVLWFTQYQNPSMVSNFYWWKEAYKCVYIMRVLPPLTVFVKCIGSLETLRKSKRKVTLQKNRCLPKPSNWQTSTWPSWWSFLQMPVYARFVTQSMEKSGKTQSDSRHLPACWKNRRRRICPVKPHYLWPKSLH